MVAVIAIDGAIGALTITSSLAVAVVSFPIALPIAFTVPVAVITVSIPITVVAAIALALTLTVMIAVPVPIALSIADRGRSAIREEDLGSAGLAVVTLTLGHGMAALSLIGVVLWAAAPDRTYTAAMRSLTSITIAIWAVASAALFVGFLFLLLKTADVLFKGAPSGVISAYSLERGHMSKLASDLLISIIDADGGIHPFHM
jgi:hypothetical protein